MSTKVLGKSLVWSHFHISSKHYGAKVIFSVRKILWIIENYVVQFVTVIGETTTYANRNSNDTNPYYYVEIQ